MYYHEPYGFFLFLISYFTIPVGTYMDGFCEVCVCLVLFNTVSLVFITL